MGYFSIIIIAFSLAADSFAVSIGSGAAIKKMRLRHALRIAAFFSVFQGVMPLIGWKLGIYARGYMEAFDHWCAFIILTFIGGKMIYESRQLKDDTKESDPLNLYILFSLAIATSIDAFAVGITFSFLEIYIIIPVVIIGLVTFIMSFAGAYIGNSFGHLFEDKIELAGGIVLIGIGTKILVEHTLF